MKDNAFLQEMREALQKRREENDKIQLDASYNELHEEIERERKSKISIELKSVTMIRSKRAEKYRGSDHYAYRWGCEIVFFETNNEFEYKICIDPENGGFLCEINMEDVIWDAEEDLREELYLCELVKGGELVCHPANCSCS